MAQSQTQKNYFSYNIIDTLYFNQPTGSELEREYGINPEFNRRHSNIFDEQSEQWKEDYIETERQFIQAVINKYLVDNCDFTNEHRIGTYFGAYKNENTDITSYYAYLNHKRGIGIELADMISNVNGMHNYKLISAKDIDFDNVILPNSAIERDFNWGGFDINRRWGDKPIRINNTFELLNVIDYLLCACDNLWNELYKLKYSVNDSAELWFSKNVSSQQLIHSSKKLVSQDFQILSNYGSRGEDTRMISYLSPFSYYSVLCDDPNNNFGIVTNFYQTVGEETADFDRKVIDVRLQNIILMSILPLSKPITGFKASTTQNVNGTLQQIWGYLIGDELKLYPGARVNSFINESHRKTNPNELIDFTNKKFKNEVFFKVSPNSSEYAKLYVKFLDVNQLGISTDVNNKNKEIKNPYFIYYNSISSETGSKVKKIISFNYEDSSIPASSTIENQLVFLFSNRGIDTYKMVDFKGNNEFNTGQVDINESTGEVYPIFYVLSDEFFSTLEVSTPQSQLFSPNSTSIIIYYYKNRNKLNCTITRPNRDTNGDPITVIAEEDPTEMNSISYHYFRYNVPDNQDITFSFDASYIASDNTPEGNPLGIKLDDEYNDIMLYDFNVNNDEEASQYYELTGINEDDESIGLYRRNFRQFDKSLFDLNVGKYVSTDSSNNQYKHIWKKQENPYKLSYTIDNDEFLSQSISNETVISEINKIIGQEELKSISYNTYVLNHKLSDDIEQLKIDLKFNIEETSKVKGVECTIPLNINKIYNPTINYYSYNVINEEKNNYSNVRYPIDGSNSQTVSLVDIYEILFTKYGSNSTDAPYGRLVNIPDLGKYMYGTINSVEDYLNDEKSYNCIASNTHFEFTYNDKLNIVNLIGSYYVDNYVSNVIGNRHGMADVNLIKTEGNNVIPYELKNSDTNSSTRNKHPYIFNFNGFGKNYRLRGSNGKVASVWDNWENRRIGAFTGWHGQFDLLSVASPNNYGSINKNLKIKLDDGNNQLKTICVSSDLNGDKWTVNNNSFNSGINIQNQGNDNQTNNDYIIKTLPVDIVKMSYVVDCNVTFYNPPAENTYITYYLPIAYMSINSSTFYPPSTCIPEYVEEDDKVTWDLNEENDVNKYNEYVKCWDDNISYYKPITMTLKLFDNTSVAGPYYYESNEAVMKFDIKRSSLTDFASIASPSNIIYVALNSRYYLSDFIRIGSISENYSQQGNSNSQIIMQPTGSYFYYDDTYKTHVIAEIPTNFNNSIFDSSHNEHYNKFIDSNGSGIYNPELGGTQYNNIIPYPVFFKKIENSDPISFYNGEGNKKYDYDIYRISDINKLRLSDDTPEPIKQQIIYLPNGQNNQDTPIYSTGNDPVYGIEVDKKIYCIDFKTDFADNFAKNIERDEDNKIHFNMVRNIFYHKGLIGSKNYLGSQPSSSDIFSTIAPIVRIKPVGQISDNVDLGNLYNMYTSRDYIYETVIEGTQTTVRETIEFFEFKYNNVYRIKQNLSGAWECNSIGPESFNSCQESYDEQLKLFLSSKVPQEGSGEQIEFIGTKEFFDNYIAPLNSSEENNG